MIPGEYFLKKEDIVCNVGRQIAIVIVTNTGDRPVQVGSHFHFFEVNSQMAFDRSKAYGMRLNIAAGTAVRFEPGEEKEVELVAVGGSGIIQGFNNHVNGKISETAKAEAMKNISVKNFKNTTA